jgi:hypothetical protein
MPGVTPVVCGLVFWRAIEWFWSHRVPITPKGCAFSYQTNFTIKQPGAPSDRWDKAIRPQVISRWCRMARWIGLHPFYHIWRSHFIPSWCLRSANVRRRHVTPGRIDLWSAVAPDRVVSPQRWAHRWKAFLLSFLTSCAPTKSEDIIFWTFSRNDWRVSRRVKLARRAPGARGFPSIGTPQTLGTSMRSPVLGGGSSMAKFASSRYSVSPEGTPGCDVTTFSYQVISRANLGNEGHFRPSGERFDPESCPNHHGDGKKRFLIKNWMKIQVTQLWKSYFDTRYSTLFR